MCRRTYEEQATLLMETNYVYAKHKGGYKPELAQKLPEAPSLPGCVEAHPCALRRG